jgi:hypothetical protein
MVEPIKGKVAQILSEYELALNIGSDNGVEKGMRFAIHSSPIAIFDPDTKEEMGQITLEMEHVEVYEVQKRFSLARTFSFTGISVPYPSLFTQSQKKLSVDRGDLVKYEATIKVGSIAVQIVDKK